MIWCDSSIVEYYMVRDLYRAHHITSHQYNIKYYPYPFSSPRNNITVMPLFKPSLYLNYSLLSISLIPTLSLSHLFSANMSKSAADMDTSWILQRVQGPALLSHIVSYCIYIHSLLLHQISWSQKRKKSKRDKDTRQGGQRRKKRIGERVDERENQMSNKRELQDF